MKKNILLLLCICFIGQVSAIETKDITENIELKYKWYLEEKIDGFYYPKKASLPEYFEDPSDIKYGDYSKWDSKYCDYPEDEYLIEKKNITTYDKVDKTRYVRVTSTTTIENDCNSCVNDIKVYYGNENINYQIIQDADKKLKLDLLKEYDTDKLWFYIDAEYRYLIYLSRLETFENVTLAYNVMRDVSNRVLVPDESWIIARTVYIKESTDQELLSSPFVKNIQVGYTCRVREINTYRYKLEKKYYDDEYYTYIEGYIPDTTDYIVNYIKDLPTETIEIIKEVPIIQIEKEYVYLETENNNINENTKNSSRSENNVEDSKANVVYKTEYVDKIIKKDPMQLYILLIFLTILVIFEFIKIMRKKVE